MFLRNIIAAAILVTIGSCNTTHSLGQSQTGTVKQQDSLLADADGNRYPVKVFAGHSLWMTANLNLNIPDSYCYENATKNCEQYGRLYTWETAKQGCSLLGEGWRLPTKDEWEQLTDLYGGVFKRDSSGSGKSAYKELLKPGNAQFNVVLGGGRAPDNGYRRGDAHGFYWTATESDNSMAYFLNFGKGSQTLYLQNDGEKADAFSVRCVKRIDSSK